jgi:hypothetical protein
MTGNTGVYVCTGQDTHPAAPVEGTGTGFDFAQRLFLLYALRVGQGKRARPSREYVSDGTLSLAELAAREGTTPAEILRATAEHRAQLNVNRLFGEGSDSSLADQLLSDAAAQEAPPVLSHIEWRCPACRRTMRFGGRRMDDLINFMASPHDTGDKVDISYDLPRWVRAV